VGLNIARFDSGPYKLTLWDLGGQARLPLRGARACACAAHTLPPRVPLSWA
jgi:hypothetical protein